MTPGKMSQKDRFELIMKYSDEILELVYNHEEYTTSDLQGRAEAIIMSVIHYTEKIVTKEVK